MLTDSQKETNLSFTTGNALNAKQQSKPPILQNNQKLYTVKSAI
jgi:hypothetical protein